MQGFEQAAALDPSNADYRLAAGVARSHEVTALIQDAAKDRLLGNDAAARAALDPRPRARPHKLSRPASISTNWPTTHAPARAATALRAESAGNMARPEPLSPTSRRRTAFTCAAIERQLIDQVFKAYGVAAMIDDSVRAIQVRLDVDDASFEEAARILGLVTNTFYVPLDAHRVLVARRHARQSHSA